MDLLVVGIGNPDRGDDAVGVMVVRSLRGVRTKELADCSGLLDVIDNETAVIVVDAMRSGEPPGTVKRFEAAVTGLPTRTFPSTHSFGLGETVELGRVLDRLPEELTIFGIEAGDLEHGCRLTAAVRDGMDAVVKAISEETC